MTDTHEMSLWLQIQPKLRKKNSYQVGQDGQEYAVEGFSVLGVTKGRPTLRKGGVAMQVTLRMPDAMFLPLVPKAVIDVPIEKVLIGEAIEVEVETPAIEVAALEGGE